MSALAPAHSPARHGDTTHETIAALRAALAMLGVTPPPSSAISSDCPRANATATVRTLWYCLVDELGQLPKDLLQVYAPSAVASAVDGDAPLALVERAAHFLMSVHVRCQHAQLQCQQAHRLLKPGRHRSPTLEVRVTTATS